MHKPYKNTKQIYKSIPTIVSVVLLVYDEFFLTTNMIVVQINKMENIVNQN
jgi:hypothetical protein